MRIYLDVDDTLADFRGHAISHGVRPWTGTWYTTDPATWSPEQHEIHEATKRLMAQEYFWERMPLHKGAHALVTAASIRAETYLLTALPIHHVDMVRRVKMNYAKNVLHFPENRVIICERKDKVNYAVGNILVDDADKNCNEWTAAGGTAILHRSIPESIAALKELVG